jgi:hypothetical protein
VVSGWFVLIKKYCWLVADKPDEDADATQFYIFISSQGFELIVSKIIISALDLFDPSIL